MISIDRQKDRYTVEELYEDLYECPKCKGGTILDHFKFCPNCGVELHWTGLTDDEIQKAWEKAHPWVVCTVCDGTGMADENHKCTCNSGLVRKK